MKIGYVRASTIEQNLDLQMEALEKAGCKKIITEEISRPFAKRPGLIQLKKELSEGDTVIVWRLNSLGRSVKQLITMINHFEMAKVGLKSLHESIDTTSSDSQSIFFMFRTLAEFERNLICERTKDGLVSARARGRMCGRPKQLDSEKRLLVAQLYNAREHTVGEISRMMGISKPTIYHYAREVKEKCE